MGDEPAGLNEAITEVVQGNPQAVAAVVGERQQPPTYPDGSPVPAEGQNNEGAAPPENAPGESQPSKVDTQGGAATGDGDVAKKLEPYTDQDGRIMYWGTDLTGIPAEKAVDIIDHFEQQDSNIRKLHERLSKEPERPAKPADEPAPEEVTDESLLKAIGLDPEDPSVQDTAGAILPLLRNQLALEDTVEELKQGFQASQAETTWNKTLDELESQFGKLPGNRLGVLNYAVEEGIATPYEAYFRLTAPAKREVESLVQQARREAAKAEAGGTLKPSSSSAGGTAITEKTSLRDAVRIAAKEAEQETRLSWADAVRGRLRTGATGPEGQA